MKKLHIFIIKSFLWPFIFTFLTAIFLLLMQFLWKYIDDLVGKGLESKDIFQLLFYASARLIPLAIPISVLLSSIMTFGNLAEKYELVAMKSAGISFRQSISYLFILVLVISTFAFLFSNYYMPYANLKAGTLLYDIRKQKPALNIKPGMFYNGIEGFSIKIDQKDDNGIDLKKIMIYDHSSEQGNNKVIIAEKGAMYLSENERYFIISLENGISYHEDKISDNQKRIHQRVSFQKNILRFDLSGFGIKRSTQDLYRNHYAMMNNQQLTHSIDSLNSTILKSSNKLSDKIKTSLLKENPNQVILNHKNVKRFTRLQKNEFYKKAIQSAKLNQSLLERSNRDLEYRENLLSKHLVEWHRKWTLSVACIVMFLIGAPLGSIIKKGGLGMPVVVSVFFFIIYHVTSITGEKMVKNSQVLAWEGMWAANALLLPIGLILVYKASKDSNIFDLTYIKDKVFKFFYKRSI